MNMPLVSARQRRRWDRTRLADELRARARDLGVTLPSNPVLLREISSWETGRTLPTDGYRDLLCDIYDASEHQLGINPKARPDGRPARVTPTGYWLRLVHPRTTARSGR